MFCRRCWLDFKPKDSYIQCSGPCAWFYHNRCVQMPDEVARQMLHNKELEWYCWQCRQLYRLQLYFEIAICDDYSLPVDFVKKRPSSFDPCLAEALPTNPENWVAASPQQEFLTFAELQQQQQQQQQSEPQIPPPPAPLSTLPSRVNAQLVAANASNTTTNNNNEPNTVASGSVAHSTLPTQPVGVHAAQTTQTLQQQQQQQQHQKKSLRSQTQQRLPHPSSASSQAVVITNNNSATLNSGTASGVGGGALNTSGAPLPPPLPAGLTSTIHSHTSAIKQASVKLIEGYSDPKDTKRHKKVYHKKAKRRAQTKRPSSQQQSQQQSSQTLQQQTKQPATTTGNNPQTLTTPQTKEKDKRSNYSSDSSAPKSSDDEDDDNHSVKVPDLNSPDSISDDLVKPLPSATNRSPRKLTTSQSEYGSKRNPSPYYYSDLLKSKEAGALGSSQVLTDKEAKQKSRQSTVSEPPPPINQLYAQPGQPYRKSTSLDVPPEHNERDEQEDEFDITEATTTTNTVLPNASHHADDHDAEDDEDDTNKRYSFTEDGVHIIRCDSPSTTTSEESDCSECLKRREWHARALALVRKTCNVQPLIPAAADYGNICQEASEDLNCGNFPETTPSMPPHRLLGPAAVCACVAPSIGDDIDEYFRPRSIFYVHPHGVHECDDCAPDSKHLNHTSSRSILDSSSLAQSDNALDEVNSTLAELEDDMSGRTRQIYETAFDCKIAKSDDDLDEVDRITNHSVLLQLNNGNVPPTTGKTESRSSKSHKSRLDGKRLKNSKNQAIQDQASNSGGNNSGSGSPLTVGQAANRSTDQILASNISGLSTDLNNVHIREPEVDQQNNPTTSSSQLPMRGYTPSPPSTAPLPMKFPGKHERFFMNSIRSAPNLPSSNPAHPRLRDLRLPLQSNLGRQSSQQQATVSSLATSNENSLNDSAYVNPPSSIIHQHHQQQQHHNSHSHHHHLSSAMHQGGANHLSAGSSRSRSRPRSFVLESGRVLELRKSHASSSSSAHHHHHHHHVGNGSRRTHNYSSTESIATSSSGGSMESLRSSTSEGNRSTSSSESRHSTSLSSHSSESGSSSVAFPLRAPVVIHSKLHILSPISDKSSQEPASELSEQNKTQNVTPEDNGGGPAVGQQQQSQQQQQQQQLSSQQQQLQDRENMRPTPQLQIDALKKRRPPANKTLMQLTDEILGSDSGISLHSREDGKPLMGLQKFTLPTLNFPPNDKGGNNHSDISAVGAMSSSVGLPQDLRDLPFDMPKLRRRKTLQQDACTSGSATSVDLGDLPFDMPKLRRRLRANQAEINNLMMHSTESSGISQASSSHSMRDDNKTGMKLDSAMFRQNLTLNLNEPRQTNNKFGSLDLRGLSNNKELNLNLNQGFANAVDLIDVSIPLERQGWYHGAITRIEAETTLRPLAEGSFLVRNCESTKQDYSLSLKGAKGFMHMRIQRNECGQYILGQFSRPFETVPDMIRHFCLNRLPVRGAEHMCLIEPVIAQLL
ncbi:probable serine/threonine-protein kinase DDB_G0282963 [Musca vetustissima]|uniref:probable serine/threonine-protein kinase DDB_G0282963 n=1 Tax=Musca vetustissima TaxID=27455 RepID=UPI002AB5EE6B|nr:probable serine/threonine-protein kinase DDB_G0282963 [Musca vetustissima]